jgi:hypothetical protein
MKKIRISKFMKILLTLMFLLILETIIIFILIEKKKLNNMDKYLPGYNTKIPITTIMNISTNPLKGYQKNILLKI